MTTLAIDIGGTKLAAALVEDNLQIRERRELPTPPVRRLRHCVMRLKRWCNRYSHKRIGWQLLRRALFVKVTCWQLTRNLGGLLHFPLVQTLEALTRLPTLAVNDAQAAAWAEYCAMADDTRDMVFVTVSTGVGGGVVSGGQLVTGTGGLAGHLGHTLADPNGPVCGCGRVGVRRGYRVGTRDRSSSARDACRM